MNFDGASFKASKFNRIYGKIMKVNLSLDLHVRKFKTVVLQFWLCRMTLNLNGYLSM